MASQGPNSPGTVVDEAGVGSVVWSDPTFATVSDNSRAIASLSGSGGQSRYLKATNFGFTIPVGATINGIVVEWEKSRNSGAASQVRDLRSRIVKGGTIGSTDKSNAGNWADGTDAYVSYGSSSDLWGETWSHSDINGSTFGAAIAAELVTAFSSANARVDHCRITVHYTEAVAGTAVGITGGCQKAKIIG